MPDPTRSAAPDPDTRSAADHAATGANPHGTTGVTSEGGTFAHAPPVSAKRYELGAEIARGGMGVVYRATDTAFGREVAVKVLQDRFGPGSGAARRFADEARITGQLQHPAIPPVHDVGTLPDGRPFLAMKLIKGNTLDDLLRARTDPSADRGRFVAAFEQVCQAVAYAHAHNVIHRDLKPANVMVGNYGEVQVMDWGLAKVLGSREAEPTDPDETAGGTAIQSLRDSDSSFTQAGSVLGTPAFMPPEQAIGAITKIDARSDVFGLGAILAVILTGKPPFAASSVETTRLHAAQGNVEECFARLDASGAEPELVSLCKRCLSKKPADRPADGDEVARAVAELRAAADERARQAELDRVKAEGDRMTAEARAEEEAKTRRVAEEKAAEQRKRRRVQLALAGFAVLVAIGGGVAAYLVQCDRLAVEKQQGDERFAAEEKRQTDLRAAAEEAARKQRETKAATLVQALASAEPGAVPVLLKELAEYRDEARPHLLELATRPAGESAGLRARLALLADPNAPKPEKGSPPLLYRVALDGDLCRPEELPLLLDRLPADFRDKLVAFGWDRVAGEIGAEFTASAKFRIAVVLFRLEPEDRRQETIAGAVADGLVRLNPLEVKPFADILQPVGHPLMGPLMKRYAESRRRIESGKLATTELVAEASAFDLAANLLARYAADRPTELAELAMLVDGRHYSLFAEAMRKNKAEVVPVLKAELAKKPPEGLPDATIDAALEAHGKRRGYAAAVLLTLGEADSVWPVFAFPKDGDPTARSYLQERLAAIGADPAVLVKRFGGEADVSARLALLIALGDFPPELVPAAEREPFVSRLLVLYRDDPNSGLHSAIDWLLRQKWGKAKELAAIDAELAREARGRVAARALAGAAVPVTLPSGVVGPQLPAPRVAVGKDWFVNGEGQTYAVVRGPVEFTLGSPPTEVGRFDTETAHRKRIPRTFAIATKEVTMSEFLRFRLTHEKTRYSPGLGAPAVGMDWYAAAEYCNWLSAREGIPSDQWCYAPAAKSGYGEGMRMKVGHLSLTGYRLPTEVEWEYTCRSGAGTARYFGRGEELLPRYGWFLKNADGRAWPVGRLRPNDRGLFDTLGNAFEWCEDPWLRYATGDREDKEDREHMSIDEQMSRILRGGSFDLRPENVRCAGRLYYRPGVCSSTDGFRPVRTLLP